MLSLQWGGGCSCGMHGEGHGDAAEDLFLAGAGGDSTMGFMVGLFHLMGTW